MLKNFPKVKSLYDLLSRAKEDARYKQLLHISSRNLGGDKTEDDMVAYRWLQTTADVLNEEGTVKEINFCRDLVK